jgi:hypothetical protein
VPIRRRTLPETLAYLAQDVIEHPGKYEPVALSILLGTLAQQASEDEAEWAKAYLAVRAERPYTVLHVVRQEGPTSELFVGFPLGGDVDGWLAEHRTDKWTHVQHAPLQRPEDAR